MSDMSIISAILVVAVAFLAGLESILDQFQFHQPLVACTLIGAATGNLTAGIMLGGSLQMIALAWANIGAAVAPDAALASVAAAIILVKGGNYLEALAKTEIVIFDKTGTLTKGVFDVQEIVAKDMEPEKLLQLAALAESHSNHPISMSLKRAYGKEIKSDIAGDVQEIAGLGVQAVIEGREILVGNAKLMTDKGIVHNEPENTGTIIHIAVGGNYEGYIVIADEIKKDAVKTIKSLKAEGVKQTVMLTGDKKSVGEQVAKELGIDQVYTELLPGDKVQKLEEIMARKSKKGKVAFVGDGVNDAPVLARSDVGIAMGGLGSDAAIEAADVVIMTDEPSKIVSAIKIAKRTVRIAKQNIFFALSVKAVVLLLGALGLANMWAAVFADVGVSVIAILNAIRVLNTNSSLQ